MVDIENRKCILITQFAFVLLICCIILQACGDGLTYSKHANITNNILTLKVERGYGFLRGFILMKNQAHLSQTENLKQLCESGQLAWDEKLTSDWLSDESVFLNQLGLKKYNLDITLVSCVSSIVAQMQSPKSMYTVIPWDNNWSQNSVVSVKLPMLVFNNNDDLYLISITQSQFDDSTLYLNMICVYR